MRQILFLFVITAAVLPLSAAEESSPPAQATAAETSQTIRNNSIELQLGEILYSGNRSYRKANEVMLHDTALDGFVLWPRMTFCFNKAKKLHFIFCLPMGFISYSGNNEAPYQGNKKIKASIDGLMSEIGGRFAFRPIEWLMLYGDMLLAWQIYERVKISSPNGETSISDEQRIFTVKPVFGLQFGTWHRLYASLQITVPVIDTDDYMFTTGVGFEIF